MSIDWSKAPLHATHWCPGNARIAGGWIYKAGGEFYGCYAHRGLEYIPDFPEWRKARLVPRPSETTWTGVGLPPLATDAEFKGHDGSWRPGTYIGQFQGKMVVGCHETGVVGFLSSEEFRPIRTPEQIAVDEREAGITQMRESVGSLNTHPFAELWDAGYRKQVSE